MLFQQSEESPPRPSPPPTRSSAHLRPECRVLTPLKKIIIRKIKDDNKRKRKEGKKKLGSGPPPRVRTRTHAGSAEALDDAAALCLATPPPRKKGLRSPPQQPPPGEPQRYQQPLGILRRCQSPTESDASTVDYHCLYCPPAKATTSVWGRGEGEGGDRRVSEDNGGGKGKGGRGGGGGRPTARKQRPKRKH